MVIRDASSLREDEPKGKRRKVSTSEKIARLRRSLGIIRKPSTFRAIASSNAYPWPFESGEEHLVLARCWTSPSKHLPRSNPAKNIASRPNVGCCPGRISAAVLVRRRTSPSRSVSRKVKPRSYADCSHSPLNFNTASCAPGLSPGSSRKDEGHRQFISTPSASVQSTEVPFGSFSAPSGGSGT